MGTFVYVRRQVVVGGQAGNVFTPNDLTAEVGDVITLEFHQKNHSVVQAAFAKPCELLDDTTTGRLGLYVSQPSIEENTMPSV